ncbi:hypothetical protein ACXO7C_04955, partial [Lactobacillus delbrueckii subsp. bulgaricus]
KSLSFQIRHFWGFQKILCYATHPYKVLGQARSASRDCLPLREHHALIQLKALTFGFLGLKNGASGTSFNFECLIFGKLLERFAQVSTRLLQDTRRNLLFP